MSAGDEPIGLTCSCRILKSSIVLEIGNLPEGFRPVAYSVLYAFVSQLVKDSVVPTAELDRMIEALRLGPSEELFDGA